MAGGRGTRLNAITGGKPKALVRLDHEFDIISVIIWQLRQHGYDRISICLSHQAESVRSEVDSFHDGIEYCVDRDGTGTAGPLRGIAGFDQPALVINGDVLTTLDFSQMHAAHVRRDAALTVATARISVRVDQGVLCIQDGRVTGIEEKPTIDLNVSGGVYVVSPRVISYLPGHHPAVDMPELIGSLMSAGEVVDAYPLMGAWHDIGTPNGLANARDAFAENRERFLAAPGSRALRGV